MDDVQGGTFFGCDWDAEGDLGGCGDDSRIEVDDDGILCGKYDISELLLSIGCCVIGG